MVEVPQMGWVDELEAVSGEDFLLHTGVGVPSLEMSLSECLAEWLGPPCEVLLAS